MKVEKRDGRIVEFDKIKIKNAIERAMSETIEGIDEILSLLIADELADDFEQRRVPVKVDEIQDMVEIMLMESPRKDVAKSYIIYRSNRGTFAKKVSFFAFFMDFKEKAEKEKKKQYLDISVENIRIEIVSFTDSNYMLI